METKKVSMIELEDFITDNNYHRFVFDSRNQEFDTINARFIFGKMKIDFNPNRITFYNNMMESYLKVEMIKSINVCKQAIGDLITIVCKDINNNGENMKYIIIAQ